MKNAELAHFWELLQKGSITPQQFIENAQQVLGPEQYAKMEPTLLSVFAGEEVVSLGPQTRSATRQAQLIQKMEEGILNYPALKRKMEQTAHDVRINDDAVSYLGLALEQHLKDLITKMMVVCRNRVVSSDASLFCYGDLSNYDVTIHSDPNASVLLLDRKNELKFKQDKPQPKQQTYKTEQIRQITANATAYYAAGGNAKSWMSMGSDAAAPMRKTAVAKPSSKGMSVKQNKIKRISMRDAAFVLTREKSLGSGKHNSTGVGKITSRMWVRTKERNVQS